MSEGATSSLESRLAARLANSAEDIADRESKRFMGMSRELGLGAAFGFTFILIFCAGALLFFWKVVLTDREQARENQRADNETKTSLAKSYEAIATQTNNHGSRLESIDDKLGTLIHKAEQAHEGDQSKWRVLTEIRDRLPGPGHKTGAAAAARPDPPPMPQDSSTGGPSPDALPGSETP